ncbi:thioredoxin family protein [Candidatus Bathyarchaeota archaeon]|nr:thioredoxin family protein [Candidatus Bathyarchaeota archaeon]
MTELFAPPPIFDGTWDDAREAGKKEKKWLLVNVQNNEDFHCHVLNRDIWKKNSAIWELVKENFIFNQYTGENVFSRNYINFYFRDRENMENYPHVAIVDPRTGEQVKVWSGSPFPDASDFHSQLVEFLDRYSLDAKSKNPVVKAKSRQPQAVDFDRMTEEEMLEMALQNSLNNGAEPSLQTPRTEDPDALTKSPRPEDKEASPEPEQPTEPSRFATISANNPHTEPEHDPAVTTRIQFRHSNGRIIRRFNAQDTVRRMFEWLKADPMEGRGSTEFELKRMPQGQDLMESLDQTIEEAGLKQGTVMIEYID